MNKDAASMVTGVILVVAITIILAAILAVFVFSMAGNLQKNQKSCGDGIQTQFKRDHSHI